MHRYALATMLALGVLAANADAGCPATPDIGYVQSIRSYTTSFRVQDAASAMPQARVIPLDSLNVVRSIFTWDTLQHILQFSAPCAPGTMDRNPMTIAMIYDTSYTGPDRKPRKSLYGQLRDTVAQLIYSENGKLNDVEHDKPFSQLYMFSWPNASFTFGLLDANSEFVGYTANRWLRTYRKDGSSTVQPGNDLKIFSLPDSASIFHWATRVNQSTLDSLQQGQLDSARLEYQVISYSYGFAPSATPLRITPLDGATGIGGGSFLRQPQAISTSRRLDGSWLISAPKAAPASIRTLDGRLVRQLPAAASITWDGRNSAGQPVHAGIYLVEVRGVGYARIPLAR